MEDQTDTHNQIIDNFNAYIEENEKFAEKNNKAAGTRARKALLEIKKLCGTRRQEIIEQRKAGEWSSSVFKEPDYLIYIRKRTSEFIHWVRFAMFGFVRKGEAFRWYNAF